MRNAKVHKHVELWRSADIYIWIFICVYICIFIHLFVYLLICLLILCSLFHGSPTLGLDGGGLLGIPIFIDFCVLVCESVPGLRRRTILIMVMDQPVDGENNP